MAIPILWRYCIARYLRIFGLSIATFITVLVVARFKEIVRFLVLSGDCLQTGAFLFYQIPLILPIAIPLSALIAPFLTFQELSKNEELQGLRSCQIPLRSILAPGLWIGFGLTLILFGILAAGTPFCRREAKNLIDKSTSTSPILLLQRQNLAHLNYPYLKILPSSKDDETAQLLMITYNHSTKKLQLIGANELQYVAPHLQGKDIATVSHFDAKGNEGFDLLVLENQKSMITEAATLSSFLKKHPPKLKESDLNLKMLLLHQSKKHSQATIEILRRIYLTLSPFLFSFLGSIFAIQNKRTPSQYPLLFLLVWISLFFCNYLIAKSLGNYPWFCALFLLSTIMTMTAAGWIRMQKIERGRL